ncbi:GNAT family N-acetyltransferase [Humibacter sp. BT305]|nr:GNAT family N-acetyltransferase [Humibacter sp. BT305]
MPGIRIRDFQVDDLDGVLHLWEQAHPAEPVYALGEVIASCQKDHAMIAVDGEQVVGAAVGRAAHAQGWIVFFGVLPSYAERNDGLGARLLSALERRMAPLGLGKLSALLPATDQHLDDYLSASFTLKQDLHYVERTVPVRRETLAVLQELGGRMPAPGLWDRVGGMTREKELLELRLVTPLSHPEVAARHGVVAPRAAMLFGPPGTGKTTFARAVASRLGWPFVEVFPSRLAGDPRGLAGGLRETFARIEELEHAVVFIDEVEEIASRRGGEPPSATQGVTNELLKLISEFREQEGRLLMCATNFIRALDPAFLRHGRFDYVIPIGLPDAAARAAIWRGHFPPAAGDVDLDALVDATDGFTPADIEYAARRAAQASLERALPAERDGATADASPDPTPSDSDGPTTGDYLAAIRATRRTVADDVAADFLADIDTLARL